MAAEEAEAQQQQRRQQRWQRRRRRQRQQQQQQAAHTRATPAACACSGIASWSCSVMMTQIIRARNSP